MTTAVLMMMCILSMVAAVAEKYGHLRTERILDSACIAVAGIWIAISGNSACLTDRLTHPWDKPYRHTIDWRDR